MLRRARGTMALPTAVVSFRPGRDVMCASEASTVCTHVHCLPPLADHTLGGKRQALSMDHHYCIKFEPRSQAKR